MPDKAAVERYAEAAWDLRCKLSAEARERPSGIDTWADRAPFLKDIDRAVARLTAAAAAADLSAELKDHMAGFLGRYGNNTAASLMLARDLAEGIRQILDRVPLGGGEQSS